MGTKGTGHGGTKRVGYGPEYRTGAGVVGSGLGAIGRAIVSPFDKHFVNWGPDTPVLLPPLAPQATNPQAATANMPATPATMPANTAPVPDVSAFASTPPTNMVGRGTLEQMLTPNQTDPREMQQYLSEPWRRLAESITPPEMESEKKPSHFATLLMAALSSIGAAMGGDYRVPLDVLTSEYQKSEDAAQRNLEAMQKYRNQQTGIVMEGLKAGQQGTQAQQEAQRGERRATIEAVGTLLGAYNENIRNNTALKRQLADHSLQEAKVMADEWRTFQTSLDDSKTAVYADALRGMAAEQGKQPDDVNLKDASPEEIEALAEELERRMGSTLLNQSRIYRQAKGKLAPLKDLAPVIDQNWDEVTQPEIEALRDLAQRKRAALQTSAGDPSVMETVFDAWTTAGGAAAKGVLDAVGKAVGYRRIPGPSSGKQQ